MATTPKNPDITVRGGLISVPNSNKPTRAPRHQPNTPTNKKNAKPRADYQIPPTITPEPPVPPQDKPEGDEPDVPAPTSEND